MEEVPFSLVERFYASCGTCGTWIEYNLKKKSDRTIDDYDRTVE